MSMTTIHTRVCERLEITTHLDVSGKAYLTVAVDSEETDGEKVVLANSMTPDEVRIMALQWLTQAEVADGDSYLFQSLRGCGYTLDRALGVVEDIQQQRVADKDRRGY